MPQNRPTLTGHPAALFVFSNLREQKGGLTRAWLRRLALFHEAGWDTHVATIHLQPEIDQTLAAWRERGLLPQRTQVHHYQRRNKRFRPAWSRPTDESFTRDDRVADWLDWLVGLLPGVVVFADSPVTYAPVAMMRNPFVGRIMTVHLGHRTVASRRRKRVAHPPRSRYQGPAGQPKLSGRFLPFASAADAVVALTHRQAEHLRNDVPGLDVRVIPNIVDPPDPGTTAVRDRLLVVQVGRLDPLKRVDHAIRAVALAEREVPGLHLAVYGRGPDLPRLEALRDELGLHDAVSFPGFTDDPLGVLASAGASLMTSRREGFGLAVAESLSVGTPVLTYDIDYGPAELVTDRVNGRVVPSGSIEDLAAALVETVLDPRWEQLSRAAPAAVEPLHGEVVARQWLALAEEVAGRVSVPDGALLVEDLRVRRTGVELVGVTISTDPGARPVRLLVPGTASAVLVPLEPTEAGHEGSVACEVRTTLTWADVSGWEVAQCLRAADASGVARPALGPGVPTTVVPTDEGLVLLHREDGSDALVRATAPGPVRLEVSPGRARAVVNGDATVLSALPLLRARLVGARAAPAAVEVECAFPGLRLDSHARITVCLRSGDEAHAVGRIRFPAHSDRGASGARARTGVLEWDAAALAGVARDRDSVQLVSMAVGRALRTLGPVEFAAVRPLPMAVGGRWLLAPSASGRLMVVPGAGLRARAAWATRRKNAIRARI